MHYSGFKRFDNYERYCWWLLTYTHEVRYDMLMRDGCIREYDIKSINWAAFIGYLEHNLSLSSANFERVDDD